MSETKDPTENTYTPAFDASDKAMCDRARERFAADRSRRLPRRKNPKATMPNFIIIGGLKCGTTSVHHYLGVHPEIHMSKPKELNFFVEEQTWDLGLDWYRGRFDSDFKVNGESSPHYTNLPRFKGVPQRIKEHCPDAKLLYMVRDPIKRILSHWTHATGAGYEPGRLEDVLGRADTSYVHRSMFWTQLQPYLELFRRDQIEIIAQEELQSAREETMRRAFDFLDVAEDFTSSEWDREWEKSSAKGDGKYQIMEKAVKLPGLRSFDRNFDRLPESLRWRVEKLVHNPDKPPAPKPKLPDDIHERFVEIFKPEVASLQEFAGREFPGWGNY